MRLGTPRRDHQPRICDLLPPQQLKPPSHQPRTTILHRILFLSSQQRPYSVRIRYRTSINQPQRPVHHFCRCHHYQQCQSTQPTAQAKAKIQFPWPAHRQSMISLTRQQNYHRPRRMLPQLHQHSQASCSHRHPVHLLHSLQHCHQHEHPYNLESHNHSHCHRHRRSLRLHLHLHLPLHLSLMYWTPWSCRRFRNMPNGPSRR